MAEVDDYNNVYLQKTLAMVSMYMVYQAIKPDLVTSMKSIFLLSHTQYTSHGALPHILMMMLTVIFHLRQRDNSLWMGLQCITGHQTVK